MFVEQFVGEVLDFSSQYGSDASISYTAHNIVGRPTKFPSYGDFSQVLKMTLNHIRLFFLTIFIDICYERLWSMVEHVPKRSRV